MEQQRYSRWRVPRQGGWPLGAVLAIVVWGSWGCAAASAADWELLLSSTPDVPGTTYKVYGLRCNVENRVYLSVKNDTAIAEAVTVRLSVPGPAGKMKPLAEQKLSVPANKTVPVLFPPPEPPKDGKPAPPPPLAPLAGPPFKIQFQVVGKAKVLAEGEVYFRILHPNQFVNVQQPEFDLLEEGNTLVVKAEAKEDFTGPPARLELVLQPDRIPGLIVNKKEGVYAQKLRKAGDKTRLVARNLLFRNLLLESWVGPPSGLVLVRVDDYARAFRFPTAFSRSGKSEIALAEPGIRIARLPGYGPPAEKLVVPLEVDTPGSLDDVTVVTQLLVPTGEGKDGPELEQRDIKKLLGARQQAVLVSAADPTGALLFNTAVQDWRVTLDTEGLFGEVRVRAQMFNRKNNEKGEPILEPFLDAKKRLIPGTVAEAVFFFDDTPPIFVKFAPVSEFPRRLVRGDPLPLKARGSDPESGIRSAVFFRGKPVLNKNAVKVPPPDAELIPAVLAEGSEKMVTAAALLPLPNVQKGIMEVSVQFVNNANQSSFDTIRIELVEPGLGKNGKLLPKLFKVEGKVLQGDIAQPNLVVLLRDEKGNLKATTRTATGLEKEKDRGSFTFIDVPPGVYSVSSINSPSRSRGQTLVTVVDGDVKDVTIKLLR